MIPIEHDKLSEWESLSVNFSKRNGLHRLYEDHFYKTTKQASTPIKKLGNHPLN